jgi:hypothetical protein
MAQKSTVIPGIELPTATELRTSQPFVADTKPAKKSATIREADNGFIVSVYAGSFSEEWVFNTMSKAIKAIIAFLNVKTEDEE